MDFRRKINFDLLARAIAQAKGRKRHQPFLAKMHTFVCYDKRKGGALRPCTKRHSGAFPYYRAALRVREVAATYNRMVETANG